MTFAAALAVMSAVLAVYVAALNHRFARAPGWRDQRWFSGVALSIAGYSALNLPIAVSGSDAVILSASRVQLLFAAIHPAAWLMYSQAQLALPPRKWERVLAGTLAVLGACALVPGAVYHEPLRRTEYAPLHLSYVVPTTTLLGDVLMTGFAVTLGLVTVRYGIAWRRRSPHALTHFAALSGFFLLALNDVLVAMGAYSGPYLVDLAFLVPIGAVGYSLTMRFAEDARALTHLRNRLESLVEERTRELSRTQDALHSAEKLAALGQFSAGVAHEVNNPSAVVGANLRYLQASLSEGAELPEDASECIRESISAVDRITAIVRQLLEAGRIAAKVVPLEPVSLARCAREAAGIARPRFPGYVTLGIAVDEDLFALGEERVLVQVLVNLLVNGAQAIPDGRRGHVAVLAERVGGGKVRVVVSDDGTGMDEGVLRRVFEPFFSTKPSGVGTGLGLAVSRGLVSSLGGKLDLESAVGRGTRATLELAAASRPAAHAEVEEPLAPPGPKRRVLLLDDEPAVLRALTRVLEPHYTVCGAASSVADAIALADLRRPDLLLCDVVMPDGGGEALYRELREHFPELARRVVFLTGGASREAARSFLAAQPQPVLHKPLDLAALAHVAERLPCHRAEAGAGCDA